jgi:hypothetical protein
MIAFTVLMGLRIMIDLFVNLDEFTESVDLSTAQVLSNIAFYYGTHSFLYFRDFAGMITVVAAVFSLGKMTKNNELIAIMASGVSLKRVIAPILFLSLLFAGLYVVDQELFIPPMADKLVRSPNAVADTLFYDMWFISDGSASLFNSPQFRVKDETIIAPTIITRSRRQDTGLYDITGIIKADSAHYKFKTKSWILDKGVSLRVSRELSDRPYEVVKSYPSDLLRPCQACTAESEGPRKALRAEKLPSYRPHNQPGYAYDIPACSGMQGPQDFKKCSICQLCFDGTMLYNGFFV